MPHADEIRIYLKDYLDYLGTLTRNAVVQADFSDIPKHLIWVPLHHHSPVPDGYELLMYNRETHETRTIFLSYAWYSAYDMDKD